MLCVAVYCPCKWCNFVMSDISVICWISCFSRMQALHQPEPLQLQADRTWHGWTVEVGTRQGCLVRTCGRVVWSTATRVVFTPVPVLFQFKNLVQFENLMFAQSCSRRLLRSRVFPVLCRVCVVVDVMWWVICRRHWLVNWLCSALNCTHSALDCVRWPHATITLDTCCVRYDVTSQLPASLSDVVHSATLTQLLTTVMWPHASMTVTLVVVDTTCWVSCLRRWVMLYTQLRSLSSWLASNCSTSPVT